MRKFAQPPMKIKDCFLIIMKMKKYIELSSLFIKNISYEVSHYRAHFIKNIILEWNGPKVEK